MSLRNRDALITGGSRGIGRGIAVRLAEDGGRIAIAYRSNKRAAQQTLLQLQSNGADCVAGQTDIAHATRADQLLKAVRDRLRRSEFGLRFFGWAAGQPSRMGPPQWHFSPRKKPST